MGYKRTYRGDRLDLEFYRGKATIDFEVQVFNDDESDFDLSIYDSLHFVIRDKIHGTIILNLGQSDGAITTSSPAFNYVILNISDSQIDIRPKEYWYECYGVREDDEQELIFFGIAAVI